MSFAASRRDRVALALLAPSLIVPIAAIAIAAYRVKHSDDGLLLPHVVGNWVVHLAALTTLSAVLFSMTLNVIAALRHSADLDQRAIAARRLRSHFIAVGLVGVWAAIFSFTTLVVDGLIFLPVVIALSVSSLVAVTQGNRVENETFIAARLRPTVGAALGVFPIAVIGLIAVSIVAIRADNDLYVISLGLLAALGLPFVAVSALVLFLPFFVFGAGGEHGPHYVFLVLVTIPALINCVLVTQALFSARRRASILNSLFKIAV